MAQVEGIRGRRTPQVVRDRIAELVREGKTAKQISEQLEAEGLWRPSERTIQHIARRLRSKDPSGRWQPWPPTGEEEERPDPRLVLPVFGTVLWHSSHRVDHVTNREALWISRLRSVADQEQVADRALYRYAQRFVAAELEGRPIDGLERSFALLLAQGGDRLSRALASSDEVPDPQERSTERERAITAGQRGEIIVRQRRKRQERTDG
ncbi:MAG: hypothetical protein ACRDG7_17405 [Candidatus Limnocylindria bacterium]